MNWKLVVILGSLLIFGSLENLFPFFQFKQPFLGRVTVNLALGLLNTVLTSFTVVVLLSWIWQQTTWQGYLLNIPWPWLRFILSLLLLDAYMYAWHRLMHTSSWGWRLHQVHHSDRAMNTSTAYRFHAIEVLLSNVPKLFLIWLFGMTPNHLLIYEMIFAAELIFHHSNWALPLHLDRALSYVIVTPNYHRAHHARLLSGMRSNYASLLTVWDTLFYSVRYPAVPEAIKLGIPGVNKEFTLLRLLVLPF